MGTTINGHQHEEWDKAGLKHHEEYADLVTYVNMTHYHDDQTQGEWWYADEDRMVIYWGTFGNYNSPGASSYTHATLYDDKVEYVLAVAEWEDMDEYADYEDSHMYEPDYDDSEPDYYEYDGGDYWSDE